MLIRSTSGLLKTQSNIDDGAFDDGWKPLTKSSKDFTKNSIIYVNNIQ